MDENDKSNSSLCSILAKLVFFCVRLSTSQFVTCKIHIVVCLLDILSLCRWKHLLGYPSESMEPNLWCCCNSHINPGDCASILFITMVQVYCSTSSLYIYWKLMALVLMGAVKIVCRQSHMQQLLVTYALDSHGWSIIRSVKESFISLLDNCYLLFFMNFSFCFNMVRESLILKSKTIKTFSLQQNSGPPFLFF